MNTQNEQNTQVKQPNSTQTGQAPSQTQDDSTLRLRRDFFRTLNLKFTISAFEYCARNDLELADLVQFSMKNHRDLVMLATPDLNYETAVNIVKQWMQEGYSMQMLHFLLIESAKVSGFFMQEEDKNALGVLATQDQNNVALVLQFLQGDLMNMMKDFQNLSQMEV